MLNLRPRESRPWTAAATFARLWLCILCIAWIPSEVHGRMQVPGSNDPTYNQPDDGTYGDGASDGEVFALALQPDGKLIVGGSFTSWNGVGRRYLLRLQVDGSVDPSFDTGAGPSDWIQALALQPDGKVLIGGSFGAYDGVPRGRVARLNAEAGASSHGPPAAIDDGCGARQAARWCEHRTSGPRR